MPILIGAHRGAMCYAPENTLAAFRIAVEQGTYRIELDVRRTSDGVLALMHDDTVDRTTNGTGRFGDFTFAALRELTLGETERVPTLSETLEFARDRVRLLVEIKDYPAVDDVVAAVRTAGAIPFCTISCFDESVLGRVKELAPSLATAWFHVRPGELEPAGLRQRLGVELLILWPAAADAEQIAAAKAAGFHIRTGLRDDLSYDQTAAEVRRLVGFGVDEIACGRPDWIARALAELD